MTDQERLLTAIYVEAQETNKLLHLVSEQLGAVFAEAGKLRDKYDPERVLREGTGGVLQPLASSEGPPGTLGLPFCIARRYIARRSRASQSERIGAGTSGSSLAC
jgi:hypothetical protein